MLPQQKLIILSIISTFIIGSITAIYIYKKKGRVNYLVLLLLLSLLPLISIARPGSYESGDLSINIYKTMALYTSLQDSVFPANWAGVLNATYGYPLFNFTYPLPYYSAAFFHFLGFSFLDSMKLFIVTTFVVSGIGMYFFLKTLVRPFSAFVGGIFFLFAPYHLVDMHFRVDIGEIAAIACIPFLFLFTTKLLQKYHPYTLLYVSFSLTALVLSHQAVSVSILPFWGFYVCLYAYLQKKKLSDLIPICIAIFLSIGLSAFYVIPVFLELRFAQQTLFQTITFESFWEFIYSPWRYGFLFQGHQGELSFIVGYAQLIILGIAIYIVCLKQPKNPQKAILWYSMISFFILMFLMQKISEPLWYIIPLIKNFQFSYRLMSCLIFFMAIIAGIVSSYLSKKLVYIIIFLAIFQTILNWGNRRNMPEMTDAYFAQNLPFSTFEGEGLTPANPIVADAKNPWFRIPPNQHLEIIKGKGEIEEVLRTTNKHVYRIHADTPLVVQENTVYFPGWNIYQNSQPLPIEISREKGEKGVMIINIPHGTSDLTVKYESTKPRQYGMLLTVLTMFICISIIIIGHKKYPIRI